MDALDCRSLQHHQRIEVMYTFARDRRQPPVLNSQCVSKHGDHISSKVRCGCVCVGTSSKQLSWADMMHSTRVKQE